MLSKKKTSREEHPTGETVTPTHSDANAALQQALKTLATDVRNDLVFRCDELPRLYASPAQLRELFAQLLHAVIAKKESATRLYLHIRCGVPDDAAMLSTLPAGSHHVCLHFQTNVLPCADWMKQHAGLLEELNQTLQTLHGSLDIHQSKTSGCLFTLTLPAKL